jgi:hypothetical protein
MTLPDANPTRKQRFTAALELAGLTIGQWCELHEVSRTHLYLVFEGERVPGADLDAAIDSTISKYLGPVAA